MLVAIGLCGCISSSDSLFKRNKLGAKRTAIKQEHYAGKLFDESFLVPEEHGTKVLWFEKYVAADKKQVANHSSYYANRIVAKLKTADGLPLLKDLVETIGRKNKLSIEIKDSIPSRALYLLEIGGPTLTDLNSLRPQLEEADFIVYTTPDYLAYLQQDNQSMVEYDIEQWYLQNRGTPYFAGGRFDADTDGLEAISRFRWGREPKASVIVAVLDTGIDVDHPALRPVLWSNPQEIPGNNRDDDGNGFRDDVHGWNFIHNNGIVFDPNGHGTHVAGLIAAQPWPGKKMRGIASNVTLLTAKCSDVKKRASIFLATKAIDYAVSKKAQIINMSFGTPDHVKYFFEAVNDALDKGVILVAAAGNDGQDLATHPVYPACYPRVITVAGTDQNDDLYSLSNYNPAIVHIAAPGVGILSTVPGGQYIAKDGTSMAAPITAGAVALIKGLHPAEDQISILRRIYNTADVLPSLNGKVHGSRRLNIYRALFQPPESFDSNGVPYRSQIVNGRLRSALSPYANSDDPAIDGSTSAKAFKIASMKQLLNLRDQDLDKHFEITNDLNWHDLPPWERESINKTFRGKLNGNGFTIHNFDLKGARGIGLYKKLGSGASIFSLRFANVNVQGQGPVGTLAAEINGAIINDVQVEGTVRGLLWTGGLGGWVTESTFANCYFEGEIDGGVNLHSTGGIVGSAGRTVIRTCHTKGIIRGARAIGGIAGSILSSKVEDCFASIEGSGRQQVGGLIGLAGQSSIFNSYTQGNLASTEPIVGGLIGEIEDSEVVQCYSLATAGTGRFRGGLLGRGWQFSVRDSYFLSHGNDPGAGGVEKSYAELEMPSTFNNWWNAPTRWSIPTGFSPVLPFLPRSGVSLY